MKEERKEKLTSTTVSIDAINVNPPLNSIIISNVKTRHPLGVQYLRAGFKLR